MRNAVRSLALLLLLGLAPVQVLLAGEDWARYRLTARVGGADGGWAASDLRPVALGPGRWSVPFPVEAGRTTPLLVAGSRGGFLGEDQTGLTAALDGAARPGWRLELGALAPAPDLGPGALRARGALTAGARSAGAGFTPGADPGARREVVVELRPLDGGPTRSPGPGGRAATWARDGLAALRAAGLDGHVPAGLAVVPGAGVPEEDVRAAFAARREDELTLVFWNLGKGEHHAHAPPVPTAAGDANVLAANLRALAAHLRPDLLCLAEVADGGAGAHPTLDPTTRAVLGALYPGQALVPSIWEFQRDNNHAVFARWPLVHAAGEERARRADGGFEARPWRLPDAPAPRDDLAVLRTRWLDWTPPGLDLAAELDYRRRWTQRSDWHTRASVRVDLTLGGRAVSVFPTHLAMPWLEVATTAVRDGFLVDGVWAQQLAGGDPLDHQAVRARADVDAVGHGRVVLLGDTNVGARPRPNFPPVRVDDAAPDLTGPGSGVPARAPLPDLPGLAPDRAPAFARLARGLEDAFAGDPGAWSWPNPAGGDPRVQVLARQLIDNCLVGDEVEVVFRAVLFPRGSDHGALAVKVRLRAPGAPRVRRPLPPATGPGPAPGADLTGPVIEVTSPARGALVGEVAAVEVRGRVTDPAGVAWLRLDGADVPVAADGGFAARVGVGPGLATFALEAADGAGNVTRGARSVLVGRALPVTAPVADALVVRLGAPAFAVAAREAEARLGAVDWGALLRARSPLYAAHLTKGQLALDVRAEGLGASLGAPALTLAPAGPGAGPGGLRVRLELPDVDVRLRVEGTPRLWRWSTSRPIASEARVTARRASVEALARVEVVPGPAGPRLAVRLEGAAVALDGLALEARLLPAFAAPYVARALEARLEALLAAKLAELVPPAVEGLLARATTPYTRPLAGRDLSLRLVPARVAFDDAGLSVALGADASLSAGAGGAAPAAHAAGSLGTPGPAPAGPDLVPAGGLAGLAVNDDLLARAGHAAWRAGLLRLHVTRASAAGLGLPAWLGRLDAGFLGHLLPGATAGLPPDAPLELEVEALAPPTVRPRAGAGLALEVGLGDLLVRVVAAPAGGPRQVVLEASVSARVPVTPTVTSEGRLRLEPAGAPTVAVDVFDAPPASPAGLTAAQQAGVEALLAVALPDALRALVARVPALSLPSLPGLRPQALRFAAAGPGGDFLAVGAAGP